MLKFLIGQGRWLCRERTVGYAPRTPAGRARSPSAPLGAMHARAVAPRPPLGRGMRPACPSRTRATIGRGRSPSAPQWIAIICAFFTIALTTLADDPTISVSAQQRYPWNGLVDLHFTITGEEGTKYDTSFAATDMVGNTNIAMRTIRKADGSVAARIEHLSPGSYKWVWDAAADLPKDWKCDRVTVTACTPLYMVIDLSTGSSSSSYPVSYLDAVPSGGWNDTYKTTKLVLRKIEPGTFKMNGSYTVKLTKQYYMGVFEVTQKQWLLVMGNRPSGYTSSEWESHPVEKVDWGTIRGNASTYNWPNNKGVAPTSFMGKLRSRTGLDFDLPTEAQWEYSCRAGTTTDYNNGTSATAANMAIVGRSHETGSGTAKVGSYKVNSWGLYDMHGNVGELCLNWMGTLSNATDPVGPSSGSSRVGRGGSFDSYYNKCTSSYRYGMPTSDNNDDGFRVSLTLSE